MKDRVYIGDVQHGGDQVTIPAAQFDRLLNLLEQAVQQERIVIRADGIGNRTNVLVQANGGNGHIPVRQLERAFDHQHDRHRLIAGPAAHTIGGPPEAGCTGI